MNKLPLLALLLIVPASAQAAARTWKDAAELTFINSRGNNELTTFGASNLFTDTYGPWGMEIKAAALTAETAGTTTSEKYEASEKGTRKYTDTLYVYEKFGWDKDRFAGIKDRFDASAGLGDELFKTEKDLLVAELGAGYIAEDRLVVENKNFVSGRAYTKYTRKLSATATFSQDAEYLHDFSDATNYRANAETSVVASLSSKMSLKIGFKVKVVNAPPPGAEKADRTTTAALIINF